MFVDELKIIAEAGNGGDGVVRWCQEKYKPKGGPAGGNGGKGGDVYVKAVRDLALLAKYRGSKTFKAGDGTHGREKSMHGKDGEDYYINVPVGATVTDVSRNRKHELMEVGEVSKILLGGRGGLGNEYFKSSTNVAPEQCTEGKLGESGIFMIELSLLVDIGLIGLPNAGKSTLLNALTNATARTGAYPFTTLEPHLGNLFGYVLADVPGLIEGASEGKGLGHKFLKHVTRTKMLLHCVSLEHEEPLKEYNLIRNELIRFDESLPKKEEIVVLTKRDLVDDEVASKQLELFKKDGIDAMIISAHTNEGIEELSKTLVHKLRNNEK